jgi:NADPH:quinone reductase-like Zn-dependent oxidoreductase
VHSVTPKGLAVHGAAALLDPPAGLELARIGTAEVACGWIGAPVPAFDRRGAHQAHALVSVSAFSLNYRDRALSLRAARSCPPGSWYVIGSELAGRVVDVGAAVTALRPGDRVMIDGAYGPGARRPWGLPTNHASRQVIALPAVKLRRVPASMPDELAACFSVVAQTSFGMVRRARVKAGERVLVTAAGSATSLAAISAARAAGADVTAVTTSAGHAGAARAAGARDVAVVCAREDPVRSLGDAGLAGPAFDVVIDPFADVYMPATVPLLRAGGRYVTCGLDDQLETAVEPEPARQVSLTVAELARVVIRNVEIIGNCLGSADDLGRALRAHDEGRFSVPVAAVLTDPPAAEALRASFGPKAVPGKIAVRYAQPWTP